MRFLADENFPRRSADLLRSLGHDIETVAALARGARDLDVLRMASEGDRVLLTFDRDFGELVFRLGQPTRGIVFIRYDHLDALRPARLVLSLLEISEMELYDFFTTITGDEVRQRRIVSP
jgi:predicted nuclease of predicted toxin-antitoxin system